MQFVCGWVRPMVWERVFFCSSICWTRRSMAVFAIRRTAGNEELICLANFSKYGQNAWLNCLEGEYEDLFTGEKLEMNSVWMNPYQYRWCVKK